MLAAMQDWEMVLTHLIDHAAAEHGSREIVTRWADGRVDRTNWSGIRRDALRMAQALRAMGIAKGERVASLAMNHAPHLVSWYGVAGAGAVLHTMNPRLFEDQLEYIVNHAEDRVLFYDAMFQPIVDAMRDRWPTVERTICYDNGEFDAWLAEQDGTGEWAEVHERDPNMLCYTSGTTGNPKGVLYEHRSTMLHALLSLQPTIFNLTPKSVMLPVVPMFHADGWGLPWACAASGTKMVFSQSNDPAVLYDLMASEGVTQSAGVPTVWLGLFQHMDAQGLELPATLEQVVCGGSAMPKAMIARLMKGGVRAAHAWGMTETSPIGTAGLEPANWDEMSFDEQVELKAMQGKVPFGVEIRCMDLDAPDKVLPRDGETAGALQVRGPWVVKRYFKADQDATDADQWFDTGDVGIIHPDGTLQLTDRTKDVIKSGGEWISSVELENAAVGCAGVQEAACIGVPHPKWDERPILVVVRKPGDDVSTDDVIDHLRDKVAKWWLPDAVEFVDEIPHTGTGKISKKDLRARFADYTLSA